MVMLKPNGISHTVYPDQPAEDFNEWTANFTRQEVARDADEFKPKFDALWSDFKNSITGCCTGYTWAPLAIAAVPPQTLTPLSAPSAWSGANTNTNEHVRGYIHPWL